jgi:regulator of protease activity HflC (stomatin/prohibitin superfamily)
MAGDDDDIEAGERGASRQAVAEDAPSRVAARPGLEDGSGAASAGGVVFFVALVAVACAAASWVLDFAGRIDHGASFPRARCASLERDAPRQLDAAAAMRLLKRSGCLDEQPLTAQQPLAGKQELPMTFSAVLYDAAWLVAALALALAAGGSSVFVVRQQTAAVIERLGRFSRVSESGLGFKWPLVEKVVGRVDLRVVQLPVQIKVLTKDRLFIDLTVNLQIKAKPEAVFDAWYKLQDAQRQISAYALNALRSVATEMSVDEFYNSRSDIESKVREELSEVIGSYGYELVGLLLENPEPSREVQAAFNRVAAATRAQEAAVKEGEAKRTLIVKEAEGQAEARRQQGKGVAWEREEIAKGFAEAVRTMEAAVQGRVDEATILAFMALAMQYDTMRDASGRGATILMPYAAGQGIETIASLAALLRTVKAEGFGGAAPAAG